MIKIPVNIYDQETGISGWNKLGQVSFQPEETRVFSELLEELRRTLVDVLWLGFPF